MMKKKVNVTARDIERGRRNFTEVLLDTSCPVDYAMGRALHVPARRVQTGYVTANVYREDGERQTIELPDVARAFVSDFDADRPVEPFSFEVSL